MIHTRLFAAPAAVFLAFLAAAPAAGAQTRQARAQSPSPATAQPQAVEAQTQQVPPALSQNAKETRQQFYRVLDQYPPALGRVLRLDPTLMTNQAYLSSYPNVAAFVAQYPDVPRNPGFYLERYDPNYSHYEPPDARREAINMWRNAIEFLGAFAIFCVGAAALFGIIKYLVEYRRWHRISKVNAEVHNKILDRFGSNEELLAYIESPAGRRFLEATPFTPSAAASTRVGAPFGRILFSVQLGVLLVALAVAMMLIAGRAIDEVQQLLNGVAILALCLGVGCVASAGASYVLSRKLGLLEEAPSPAPPTQPL
jgi:hypothetical protein